MKIYLTNLSQYNSGRLIGEWVQLPCSGEELQDAIARSLAYDGYMEREEGGIYYAG